MGIIHTDIKPENVFIDSHDNFYVADLGSFEKVSQEQRQGAPIYKNLSPDEVEGTYGWMAPEIILIKIEKQTRQVDLSKISIFGLGLTICFALDSENLVKKLEKLNLEKDQLSNYLNELENKINNKEFMDLIRKMLSFEASERISILDLYRWMVIKNKK